MFFLRQIFITYIDHGITIDQLVSEMREICGFPRTHPFTVKWVDEEGDPCTISSQPELDEAIRLYEVNKEAELAIHGKIHIQALIMTNTIPKERKKERKEGKD